jgi:cytoskeletal protein CcmA (bactofilin family)
MANITAAQFIDWLFGQGNPTIDNRRSDQRIQVAGDVVLGARSGVIRRKTLENFDFRSDVRLSNSHFGSRLEILNCSAGVISFEESRIDGSLKMVGGQIGSVLMSDARIKGSLGLYNTEIGRNLDLSGIGVDGSVHLGQSGGPDQSLSIRGELTARNARVRGDFILRGATIGSWAGKETALDLCGATIEGEVWLLPVLSNDQIAISGAMKIQGSVDAQRLCCSGDLTLQAVTITGDLILNAAKLGGFWAYPAENIRVEIGGDLLLNAVLSHPWISLQGIMVHGDFKVLGSELSHLELTVALVSNGKEPYEHDIVPSTVGRFFMRGEVHGNLAIPFVQVNGTDDSADRQGVVIEGSAIGGALQFWLPSKIGDMWRERFGPGSTIPIHAWRYSAAVVGDIRVENSTIRGELNLSFAKATGRIAVTDSHIMGGVMFCSTQTASVEMAERDGKARAEQEDALDPLMRASASEVVLRMLNVDNDIDLTGLSVFYDANNLWKTDRSGKIDATQLNVKGRIKAYDGVRDATGTIRETYIEVPGKFDLSNVVASELEISGHSFPLVSMPQVPSSNDDYPNGLILSGGNIATITIPEIEAGKRRQPGRPYPVALDDLTVKAWNIGKTDNVSHYLNLLRKDHIFRRSNYTSIENYLRNRGEDHYATKIYRNMWKRERAERAGIFTKIKLWIYGPLLFFGTNLWPLFGIILLFAVVGYPLYRHPANIEPSLARLAAHALRDTHTIAKHGISPVPSDWTTADAVWMEFRYQVPIVAMALRDEWTVRAEPKAVYDFAALWDLTGFWANEQFPSCLPADEFAPRLPPDIKHPGRYGECHSKTTFVIPIAAEDAAGILTIFNYIMWPLLIGFLLRKLLRTREG